MKQLLIPVQKQVQTPKLSQFKILSSDVLQATSQELEKRFGRYWGSKELQLFEESSCWLSSTHPETLSEHLTAQLFAYDEANEEIIQWLCSQADSNGYLLLSAAERAPWPKEQVLKQIEIASHLDPPGCLAFSLSQCLKAQCEESDAAESETGEILCEYLPEVAEGNLQKIAVETGMELDEILEGINFLKTLHPKPGSSFAPEALPIDIVADIVWKDHNWIIQMRKPSLFQNGQEEDWKDDPQARQVLDALEWRQITMLSILEICTFWQTSWLLGGPKKAFLQKQAAASANVSPSTLCRAIENKAVCLDGKQILLKDFFSEGIGSMGKEEIIFLLRQLIQKENPLEPYSDEMLRCLLKSKNIVVSRRTIAKYRKEAGISSAFIRKRQSTS